MTAPGESDNAAAASPAGRATGRHDASGADLPGYMAEWRRRGFADALLGSA